MPDLRRLVAVAASVLAAGVAVPAWAQGAPEPVDLGVYGTPIRFEAPEGVTIELGSGRRIVDALEVRSHPSGDGMVVIAEMGMEDYVAGLAEMPVSWPLEALKAQAVAGRTYAWYQMSLGTFQRRGLGYDICATVACQVFHGREIVETPVFGARWQQAVDETAGEVLMHDGEPILARYFSTSGGATRNNEDVFPDEGPRPYLKGVEDPDDAVSPMHEWRVTFTREQFDELLAAGQTLSAAVPFEDAEVVKKGPGVPDVVRVTGRDGTVVEVTAGQMRAFVSDVAPQLFPDDHPARRRDGNRLPAALPSSRFQIDVREHRVVIDGRGWGHGVGLGQYGAKGKAERGMAYDEILATYYNGLRPQRPDALPERVRVGLADDVSELAVRGDGPLTVRVGDVTLTERALGTWRLGAAADRTVRLLAPTGYGAPLVVDGTTASRSRPTTVETIQLETVVNKPAELAVEVADRDGTVLFQRAVGIVEAGRHTMSWSLDGPDGDLVPGSYRVALVATDENGERAGAAADVEVLALEAASPPASALPLLDIPLDVPDTPVGLLVVAALAGVAAGGMVAHAASRR